MAHLNKLPNSCHWAKQDFSSVLLSSYPSARDTGLLHCREISCTTCAMPIRVARQNPGSTFAAFLALTLGIGATTAIFSVADSVILRPLPVKDPDRVVRIFETKGSARQAEISMADYIDWKANLKSFDSLAIYRQSQANLTGASNPERVRILLMRVDACCHCSVPTRLRGRNFFAQEDQPGHKGVAILSCVILARHFGGQESGQKDPAGR